VGRSAAAHLSQRRDDPWRRVRLGLLAITGVLVIGTVGYWIQGLGVVDAAYQTVTTVTTVGFRELGEVDRDYQLFTIVLILTGVGTVLYTFTMLLETIVDGQLSMRYWRRRMQRDIDQMSGHVVIAGWGRLGKTIATELARHDRDLVVIDRDEKIRTSPHPFVEGDATDDEVLRAAGMERAATLIAALDADTANVYLTLSARATCPTLYIIARARDESADAKLRQAGADRVVNPQHIGGVRIASMTLQPHVLEFVDVAFHDAGVEFRLEELAVPEGSTLDGKSLAASRLRDRTGVMVLAMRQPGGEFLPNPSSDSVIHAGQVLIVIGTPEQLTALESLALGSSVASDR
jgi:voltage-gated potassium channel